MQRNNLKMCLRSTDRATDTSEVAKVCPPLFYVSLLTFTLLSTLIHINDFSALET